MSRPQTLEEWLAYLETLHPHRIALGLDRVHAVLDRLGLALEVPVITVTGTNGKGSTCALLDAMLRSAGYATGAYTSPHLVRYNERVRINGVEVADDALIDAFDRVEHARTTPGEPVIPLTYFEFGTLAAINVFAAARLDAVVLEVGLGGRLDAVNALDADVAVVTALDIDHIDYLGPDRASIAHEKAGIFRSGRPAICGDPDPPPTFIDEARTRGVPLQVRGRAFGYVFEGTQWRFWSPAGARYGLPPPALRGEYQLSNAACAIAALEALDGRLAIHASAIRDGLSSVELPGRFQVLPGRPTVVLDVAHNPHAARALASTLGTMGFHPATYAVMGMLRDKDIDGVIEALRGRIDRWHVASLPGPRGASAALLRDRLLHANVPDATIQLFDGNSDIAGMPEHLDHCVAEALEAARMNASEADRIVVFGSFLTVAAALATLRAT